VAEQSDPRANIASALAGYLTPEQVTTLTDEILAITKKAWADVKCKHCGKAQRVLVEIADARAVTASLTDLMKEGFGRPIEAASADEEKIVFTRVVNLVAPPDPE